MGGFVVPAYAVCAAAPLAGFQVNAACGVRWRPGSHLATPAAHTIPPRSWSSRSFRCRYPIPCRPCRPCRLPRLSRGFSVRLLDILDRLESHAKPSSPCKNTLCERAYKDGQAFAWPWPYFPACQRPMMQAPRQPHRRTTKRYYTKPCQSASYQLQQYHMMPIGIM